MQVEAQDRAEWDAAIAEYHTLERAGSGDKKPLKFVPKGDGPPPTNIPELKARPLTKEEFAQVAESLTARQNAGSTGYRSRSPPLTFHPTTMTARKG